MASKHPYLRKSQIGTPAEKYFNKNYEYLKSLAPKAHPRVRYTDMPTKDKERAALKKAETKGMQPSATKAYMKKYGGDKANAKKSLKALYSFSYASGSEPKTK